MNLASVVCVHGGPRGRCRNGVLILTCASTLSRSHERRCQPLISCSATFLLHHILWKWASVRFGAFHSRMWRGGVFKKIRAPQVCGWHHRCCQWYKVRVGGCVTEGGGTVHPHETRSTLARFGVWWSPTPPRRQPTHQKPRQRPASSGSSSAYPDSRVFSGFGTFRGGVMSGPKPRSVRRCPGSWVRERRRETTEPVRRRGARGCVGSG